jgi:predicted transglutaminase-like cysteine proteinase
MSPSHDFTDIGDVLNFELLRGIVTAVNENDDTCTVTVDGKSVTALLFYHCESGSVMRESGAIEGAALGFTVGDEVIVLKKYDDSAIKVIGHVGGVRRCGENTDGKYYLFYRDGEDLKIANCSYNSDIEVLNTLDAKQVYAVKSLIPGSEWWQVKWLCKRFNHSVDGVYRNLYFIATNLKINPNPYTGWTAFATANPSHPLVTNTTNTQITMTAQVLADLNAVNKQVNNEHTYTPDTGNDNWKILSEGQSGDCEDFALTKAAALLALGYPASAIHIECGLSETQMREDGYPKGHAWLVVQTTLADYALDLGRDDAVVNSALRWPTIPTEDFICRRRQIGSKWAFISAFGWMMSSIDSNSYGGAYWYILDPALNILHPMFNNSYVSMPWYSEADAGDYTLPSVNFSNDDIYAKYSTNLYTYRLIQNTLTLISTASCSANGWVNKAGAIPPIGAIFNWSAGTFFGTADIISKDGYYDFAFIDLVQVTPNPNYPLTYSLSMATNPVMWANVDLPQSNEVAVRYISSIISNKFNDNLYLYEAWGTDIPRVLPYYHTPFGETIQRTDLNFNPWFWLHIESANVLFQGFAYMRDYTQIGYTRNDGKFRIYKNGASCLPELEAAVGVTSNGDFPGLAYVQSTDRLNRT